jgi:SP family general alpha glucoside:H+ symporter-like MFS transporter
MGHFIGAGILRAANDIKGTWSYRMPFAVQWVWMPFLIPAMLFAPESPYWYIRKGKLDKAEKTVRRIAPSAERDRAQEIVSSMVRINAVEQKVSGGTSFADCFKGVDRRRTEIRSEQVLQRSSIAANDLLAVSFGQLR